MDLQEKFEAGAANHTYRRIDSEYQVNFFLGYNDDGQMSMVLTEFGKEQPVKSSKLITVTLKKRGDGKLALSFDLIDNAYKQMFVIFCKDLIVTCEKAGRDMAISSAIIRWNYWKELFGRKSGNILDNLSIKGLIGELIQLRDFFIPRFGAEKAVSCWMGPLLGHKDFEINNTWYEVKSVNENAIQITINSLEQLDSDSEGHLIVSKLEDTSVVNDKGIDLNQMVLEITNYINNPETLDLFRTRLNNYGYEYDDEYQKHKFLYFGSSSYLVSDGFPKLTREKVPSSIGNVKYTLLINALSDFKEEELS